MKHHIQTFDWNDPSKRDPHKSVVYDYSDSIQINPKTQIAKTFTNDGYLKVIFPTDSKQWSHPHLILQDVSYHLSALYVLAKPQPEMILENMPMMNGTKVFVRIPLATQSFPFLKKETCLDLLLRTNIQDGTEEIHCDFNSLLGNHTETVLYQGSTVLYWSKPISIKTDLSIMENVVSPFTEFDIPTYSPDYRIVSANNASSIVETFQEGMDEEEYDCKIVDESEDQVKLMQIPYFSDSLTNLSQKNMMQAVLYMFYMGIIVIFAVFTFPYVYNAILTKVNGDKPVTLKGDTFEYRANITNREILQPKNKAFQCFIWVIGIFMFITSLMFFTDGVIREDIIEIGFGISMTSLISMVFIVIIIYNRLFIFVGKKNEYKNIDFLKHLVKFIFQPITLTNAVGDAVNCVIERKDSHKKGERFSYLVKIAFFTVITFLLVVYINGDKTEFSPAFYFGCIFMVFTFTILVHYLSPFPPKEENSINIGGYPFFEYINDSSTNGL